MKQFLWGLSVVLILAPAVSHAEIYKWKDKNGVIRYSDVPPPSNVPHESLGKKANKVPAQVDAPSAASDAPSEPVPAQQTPEQTPPAAEGPVPEEEAGRKSAETAEAEQRQKQENCATARANLANFQQGGRVYKMNEQGEREYMGDSDLAQGLENAQMEVDKYCS